VMTIKINLRMWRVRCNDTSQVVRKYSGVTLDSQRICERSSEHGSANNDAGNAATLNKVDVLDSIRV
jgi:uncharacterized phage protein gp47/JayE